MTKKRTLVALSLSALVILSIVAVYVNFRQASAQDVQPSIPGIFLKIDTIEGESQNEEHSHEIDILSYSWGENRTSLGPTGLGTSLLSVKDFTFETTFSQASPKLFLACTSGKHIKSAVLTVQTRVGESSIDYLTWKFEEVTINSYNTAANIYVNSKPVDQFSIGFGKLGVIYKQVLPDGTIGGIFTAGWDFAAKREYTPSL